MLQRLIQSLRGPQAKEEPMPQEQSDLALGALLVRAAMVDGAYLFEEVEQIDRVLARRHGISAEKAAEMRGVCETLEAHMPHALELSSLLRHRIPLAERKAIVSALWSVVFADGIAHRNEDRMMQVVEEILDIDPATSLALRKTEFDRANPLWARPPADPEAR